MYITSTNEIILQDLWSHSLTFYRSDFRKFNVLVAPQPRTPMRVSPNNSRKDTPNPHVQTDHPDFGLWVNHDTDLTLIDFRDNSTTCIEDFFLVGESFLVPVSLSLSLTLGSIIAMGYTIDPCEYRRYFLTRCDRDSGLVVHKSLRDVADKCRLALRRLARREDHVPVADCWRPAPAAGRHRLLF